MKFPNLSAWAVNHPAFILYLILSLTTAGIYAYFQMGRAEDPTFVIKTMVIEAAWPGADADEVRRQVADPIEKKLQELPYFDFTKTFCRPGLAVVQLQLRDTVPGREVSDLWYQARKKIGDIKSSLPEGLQGPYFDDEYGDVYSAVYAFTGDGFTPADLKRVAEAAKLRLLKIPGVDKVSLEANRPEKVFVEFSHRKLATLGISPTALLDSIRRQNAVTPAGSIDTPTDRVYVRVDGPFDAAERVRNVPVAAGGRVLRVSDIADVRRGYEDAPTFTMRFDGKPAIGLAVFMAKGENVLRLGESLDVEITRIKADLPVGVDVSPVNFQPQVVKESVGEFLRSFAEALTIVLLVSFLSLGLRSGVIVALSVPIVLAVCFVIMNACGMNFDRITLGALILALGLLVDDAIIAVEMMIVKMEEGWDRARAATFAWTSTAGPMLSGTLITAAGFLPVGFARSTAGEYAGNIFWIVGLALIVSWVVAVLFTPFLGVKLLPKYEYDATAEAYQSRFHRIVRHVVTRCAQRPKLVIGVTAGAFFASLGLFTLIPQQFFPQSSRPELMVDLKLPEGASFAATEAEVTKLEAMLRADPDVQHFTAYTGAGSPRFYLSLNPDLASPNFAKFIIMTPGPKYREKLRDRLIQLFADDRMFPNLRGRVTRLEFGPPVGFPVQFRVVGPDPMTARQLGFKVQDIMRANADTRDVQLDWAEPSKVVRLHVDQDRIRTLGFNPQDVASTLQTLLSGVPVSQYREGKELIDVVARAIPQERLNLGSLPDLTLISPAGAPVPLAQVATASNEQEEPIIWTRSQEPVVTVRSDIVDGAQPVDVTKALLPALAPIRSSLPAGYRIETGGAVEESGKADKALFSIFPVMILVMWTLLMAQTQSFRKAALVFGIAPLGLIGATIALLAFHAPFGFVALLGVIALAGMDMRNSVILIEQIRHDMAEGLSEWDAVIESAVRRARPVILTAATAILAMIPLTRSVFWGPMAMAIMGGLTVATFLTLLNLPAIYVLLFRVKPIEEIHASTELSEFGSSDKSETMLTI